jgi:hypothetical protein
MVMNKNLHFFIRAKNTGKNRFVIATVLISVLVMALASCSRGEPDLMQGDVYMGNTAGNIANGGCFVQSPDGGVYLAFDEIFGKGLYYIPSSDSSGFTENMTDDMGVDTSYPYLNIAEKVTEDIDVSTDDPYLNIVDGELYFSYLEDYKKISLGSPGNEPDSLGIDSNELIYIVNGWIYYAESRTGRLKKCRTDGMDKTTITKMETGGIRTIGSGWIVYWSDGYLYKIRTNGEEKTKLLDGIVVDDSPQCIISDDWLYYIGDAGGGRHSIKKIQLNTGEDVMIFDAGMGWVRWMTVQDDWIYYYYDNGVYKIGTDGEGQTLLYESEEAPQNIAVIGEWIYWLNGGTIASFDPATSGKTCLVTRVATDGSAAEGILLK